MNAAFPHRIVPAARERLRLRPEAWLGLAPMLVVVLMALPIAAGLIGTLAPAFGYLPALGAERVGLEAWRALVVEPGLVRAAALSLWTGLGAALLSLGLALALVGGFARARRLWTLNATMLPALAVPHAAFALGLAFLLAPSGWIARLLSPWASGWTRPPDLATVQDPYGLALMLGLVLKETPFLVLMATTALRRIPWRRRVAQARLLGYPERSAWRHAVQPDLYRQIRLPVLAVLVYGVSVVDMALILGPTAPPTLGVLLLRWFNDPDLARRLVASAGAVLQLGLAVAAVVLWLIGERVIGRLLRHGRRSGRRGRKGVGGGAAVLAGLHGALCLAVLLALVLWSLARSWRFPDALPSSWSLRAWTGTGSGLGPLLGDTLLVAAAAAAVALVLSIACLEQERRSGRQAGPGATLLLYMPLLVPQIAFLFGWQVVLVRLGLDGTLPSVLATHLVFVLPYVFLTLADPYRALDPRYARAARTLGKPALTVWLRITAPLLRGPLAFAAAAGFAVSVAQYLPTVFAGGGRVATLTTDAVGLAAGGDRREVAVLGLCLALLPLIAFALPAVLAPRRPDGARAAVR